MEIKISNISSTPIYQQIANSIKNKILSREYISNTQLPSIRSLAKELEVGIITVKKAYEEILLIKKREYIVEFKQMIENATDDGLTKGDINEILKIVLGEKDYENQSK